MTLLKGHEPSWQMLPINIVHCSEEISMSAEPSRSVFKMENSSLVQAVKAVRDDVAHAVISAGNSGAALVAGMMHIGKIPGILRPAIGGFLPTRQNSVFCIDLGANVDPKPEYLKQFALMGYAYVRLTKGIEKPRIALLANGTEPSKGTRLIQQVHALLASSSLPFVGNCEPYDILNDCADVIVCEGFSGNVMLKSLEATIHVVTQWLKDEGNKTLLGQCVGFFGSPIFRRLKKNIKKAQRGGALLLGLQKPMIIAHGSSDGEAIEDAITFAHNVAIQDFNKAFIDEVQQLLQLNEQQFPQANQSTLNL
jgi:glycerol-3-phosphate acyltransferase PlsX